MHLAPTASTTVVVLRLFYVKGMACRKMTNYSLLSQWPCYPVLGLTVRAFSCQYLPPVIFTIPLVGWWLKPSGSLTWCSREGFVWKGVNGWDAGVTLSIFLHSEACLLISFLWSLEFYLFLHSDKRASGWAAHLHIWALSSTSGKTLEPQRLT